MTDEKHQLSLFAPAKAAPKEERKGPVEVRTLTDVVQNFLATRGPRACRSCGCTDQDPCRLSDGDPCILNHATGYCSKADCQAARLHLRRAS